MHDGKANDLSGLLGFVLPSLLNIFPDGKRAEFYGITKLYRSDPQPFREDLPKLFQMLAERKIKPVIAAILPLSDAARANEMLEKGDVQGKLVLQCAATI